MWYWQTFDFLVLKGRKPTTLWKRWKLTISRRICATLLGCRKPTTLWKRWKLGFHQLLQCSVLCWVGNPLLSERDGNLDPARSFVNVIKPQSETHYSLKEMETFYRICIIYSCYFCRKPTTLWKRWKQGHSHRTPSSFYNSVGNPLLSERDGNSCKNAAPFEKSFFSRKPTTLWKRWKLGKFPGEHFLQYPRSETHYSLKEMETSFLTPCSPFGDYPSETHYSLKEMETQSAVVEEFYKSVWRRKPTTLWKRWKRVRAWHSRSTENSRVGNPLLSERDGNSWGTTSFVVHLKSCRKPTTLWKRWKPTGRHP